MTDSPKTQPETIHHILAHSYSFYLIALVAGIVLDTLFNVRVFSEDAQAFGMVIIIVASLLIVWAQSTSSKLRRVRNEKGRLETADFCRGPYCVSRIPTHWGLALMLAGFGLTINSIFVVAAAVVIFIITKRVFVKKEENILAQKYGEEYLKYKKRVRI